MNRFFTVGAAIAAAQLLWSAPAHALLIDDFTGSQSVSIALGGSNPTTVSNAVGGFGASVLGGERDMLITRTAAGSTGSFGADANLSLPGDFSHAQGAGVAGISVLTWDGGDGTAATVDTAGLGGVDLTELGSQNAIEISFLSVDQTATVTIQVFTDGLGSSTQTIAISTVGTVTFDFASFVGAADFADVGAIQLTIDGTAANGIDLDATLDFVQTVPEPSTALLLGVGLIAFATRRRVS